MYYWVTANYKGMIILGPYMSEEQANEKGYEKLAGLSVPFDVVQLDTRDPRAARNKLRHKRMGNDNYDNVMQRARYKLPESEKGGDAFNEFT